MATLNGGTTIAGYEAIHEGNLDTKQIARTFGIINSAKKIVNAISVSNYNTLDPSVISTEQGCIATIKAPNSANAPWNNTTSGFIMQSNPDSGSSGSYHLIIFRSGGDGWAYRSWYQGTWSTWKIWSTFDGSYNSLSNKPTSFPANGGNADTVGGKSTSDFAPSGYGLGGSAKRLGSVDLNTVTNNGWYDASNVTNGVTDIGTGYHKLLVVCSADNNYITQLAFTMTTSTTGSMYIREKRAGTWGSWTKIAKSVDIPTSLPANGGNSATATKLQTARKINGISFDGTSDITITANGDEANSIKKYSCSSASDAQNKYTKIASISINNQFADANAVLELSSSGSGNYTETKGKIFFRVKQQNALGSAPGIDLKITNNEVINNNNFVAVTTTNSTSNTTVELYYKTVQPYDSLNFVPLISNGCVFYSSQSLLTALPSGTQTNCSHLQFDYYNLSNAPKIKSGSGTFKGNSTEVTIAHGLGKVPTAATITPAGNYGGAVGDTWVRFDSTNIYVGNSGSSTGNFYWIAT